MSIFASSENMRSRLVDNSFDALPFRAQAEPMLPHEYILLLDEYEKLCSDQAINGAMLHASMNEGAETYHDNSPMEAVRDLQNFTTYPRARHIMGLLHEAVICPYPSSATEKIYPGACAEVKWLDDNETELFGLVHFPDLISDTEGLQFTPTSLGSNLGRALLGSSLGKRTMHNMQNETCFEILRIENILMARTFRELVKDQQDAIDALFHIPNISQDIGS